MSKRSRPDGPCRTKATYDHKRPRYDPPSPDRIAAAEALLGIEWARDRAIDRQIKKVGLATVLGITQPKEPFKRRI
jgi:hypothetical protein